jgi:hypothetical protein
MFFYGGEARWLAEAGRVIAQLGELERLHAFLVFVWGKATSAAEDRARFRGLFEQAGFPRLGFDRASEFAQSLPAPARSRHPVRRVAVLCQHMSIFAQAGTRLALEHAALLSAAGCEVRLFSAQEMSSVGIAGWLGCPTQVTLAPPAPETWKPMAAPGKFEARVARDASPVRARWQETAAGIAQFDPDVVLFVGFFSPLLLWAHRHFPVLGLSVHTLPPLGPIDAWLHQYDAGPLPQPWAGLPDYEAVAYPFRMALPPPVSLSLAPLQLPPNARLAVSVGYRLHTEIGAEWAAQWMARLHAHPNWVWLLVGDATAPPSLPAGDRQVRVLGHQDHIDALLARCDLYVNPPRMGGGFSILNAIGRGVAAVSLGGSDGGDKLGPWAAASMDDYWRRIDTLLVDDAARKQCGQGLARRFDALYNLRSATPGLLGALETASARFRQRTGPEP